jgi:hypothetical protein
MSCHPRVVTPTEALDAIHGHAAANRIEMTHHARQRMRERGVSYSDLRHALAKATGCHAEPEERWRVDGADLDGDDLSVVLVIEEGVVVVTLF